MPKMFPTRMGDGERVQMPPSEIRDELRRGIESAAALARIPGLTDDEIEQLFEIITEPGRVVSVPHGHELIVTDDGMAECFTGSEADGCSGISMGRHASVLAYERALAADTSSLGHSDYSFKPVKAVLEVELQTYYQLSLLTTAPLFYGSQPNMGQYFQPDGPFPNPVDLMPAGNIKAAQTAQEEQKENTAQRPLHVKVENQVGSDPDHQEGEHQKKKAREHLGRQVLEGCQGGGLKALERPVFAITNDDIADTPEGAEHHIHCQNAWK